MELAETLRKCSRPRVCLCEAAHYNECISNLCGIVDKICTSPANLTVTVTTALITDTPPHQQLPLRK